MAEVVPEPSQAESFESPLTRQKKWIESRPKLKTLLILRILYFLTYYIENQILKTQLDTSSTAQGGGGSFRIGNL